MRIFADCSDIAVMKSVADKVSGFTTNPSLMKAARVTNYEPFGKQCVATFPDHSLSFEVIADTLDGMRTQAQRIASWGDQVVVKIPVTTTDGTSTNPLVWELQHEYGINVNVTAVFTLDQVIGLLSVTRSARPHIISIFAGRIADTGVDPSQLIQETVELAGSSTDILWASTREALNIRQAEEAGAHIITVTPDLLAKYANYGKDLNTFSRETVQMFYDDARAAGLSL